MVILSMDDMLKRLGWTDGFHIPIANAINRALEDEVMSLTLRMAKSTATFDFTKSKYESLQKHFKFLLVESEQNQILLAELRRQIIMENHQYQINKGRNAKIEQEIGQMNKDVDEIEERIVLKKIDLKRTFVKMQIINGDAVWDTEALLGWDDSVLSKEGDNKCLVKYTEEDKHRMKELEAKRQAVCLEVVNRKKLIEKMVADCLNYEQVLDKTVKLFKNQSIEQQALLVRWQDSIGVLRQRNVDLHNMQLQIETTSQSLLEQKDLVEEQNNFLKIERTNNDDIEEETVCLNQKNSTARKDLNQLIEYIALLNNDHGTVQRLLNNSGQQLHKERINGKQMISDVEQKKQQISILHTELVELKLRSDKINMSTMSAADRVKNLESIIDHENQLEVTFDVDITRMQSILYKSQQLLREICDAYCVTEIEVSGCQMTLRLLHRRAEIERAMKEKQEASIYELEFRIDRLNSNLQHTEGALKNVENYELMQIRINGLEERFITEKEVRTHLQNQVTRLSDDMRRLISSIAADATAYDELQGKLVDNKLLHEGGLKMVQTAKHRSQQRQVSQNIFRLRVSQLDKYISKEDSNIYNLKRYQIDLESAMQTRKVEIESHRDVVLAHRNIINEDNNRLRMDISKRGIRLEQFNSKHHIALMSLGQDEDGEPLSVTYVKVRNAQEKYELEKKGDDLDSKINKMENEIVAMENTLKVVNITNQKFRSSLTSIEESDHEAREMQKLEKQVNECILKSKKVNKLVVEKQERIYDLQDSCNELNIKEDDLRNLLTNLQNENNRYKKEAAERFEKINRTNRQIRANGGKIQNQIKIKYNKDLHIRQMQDANKTALQKLVNLSDRYTSLCPLITGYIAKQNLLFPKAENSPSENISNTTSDSVLTPDMPSTNGYSATTDMEVQSISTNNISNVTEIKTVDN